ncbi:CPBP family intramembrane glutamic endopeptidase [Hymenobacter sp. DG01]|uniref:CPBP family intramembrane glutamic endopeptidase n=1 Tax=Hymenobacter sp. DG01 TaxID=2584940 RepID=UPI00112006DB|nr:type II CAAX endopeptidase family protein [Hymenobacter sp. DG01]
MKKRLLPAAVILVAFLVALYGARYVNPLLGYNSRQATDLVFSLQRAAWWLGVPMLTLAALYGWRRVLPELGWQASVGSGLLMGLGCTLPMLLGYAGAFQFTSAAGPELFSKLLRGAWWAGISEETLFRGFLFGQLYRRVRLHWLLAVLVQSGFFASVHLYQSHDWASAATVLGVTFCGGVWFAWLYKSWNNLWVPVFLHIFMNAWWMLFEVSDTAVGSLWANVFRGLTIVLSIVGTVWHLRRQRVAAKPESVPEWTGVAEAIR